MIQTTKQTICKMGTGDTCDGLGCPATGSTLLQFMYSTKVLLLYYLYIAPVTFICMIYSIAVQDGINTIKNVYSAKERSALQYACM